MTYRVIYDDGEHVDEGKIYGQGLTYEQGVRNVMQDPDRRSLVNENTGRAASWVWPIPDHMRDNPRLKTILAQGKHPVPDEIVRRIAHNLTKDGIV